MLLFFSTEAQQWLSNMKEATLIKNLQQQITSKIINQVYIKQKERQLAKTVTIPSHT